jgi:hypothetical protein
MWLEGVIQDHLDVGRPDQIMLIFHRWVTVVTPDVSYPSHQPKRRPHAVLLLQVFAGQAVCKGDTEMGRNFYPPPPDMRKAETQRLTDGELFFIIVNESG